MNIKHYLMAISLIFILSVNCFAFADEPSAWAVDEVENAVEADLIPDNLQSNYTQSITREEFCILAIKMIEVKTGMSIEDYIDEVGVVLAPLDTFADTSNISVRAAKTLGITDGTSATEFSPNALLNREQAAKFLTSTSMACGSIVDLSTPVYSDVGDIAVWARPYTGYVYDIDVMKGVGEDKFNPKGSFQRQQAFMTINRLFNEIDSINTIRVGEMLTGKSNLAVEIKENTEIDDSATLDDIENLLYSKNQREEYNNINKHHFHLPRKG